MTLIKDGRIVEDPWVTLSDGEAAEPETPVIVNLDRWQADRETLAGRNAGLGLRLRSDQSPENVKDDLDWFDVIALEFPVYTDGRSYSHARLLRERYGYKGELRAVGNVLRDQLLFMRRCGFDALDVENEDAVSAYEKAMAEIDVFYQPAADGREPLWRLRRG